MSRLDLLQIECERGNFHHVNDTSESKEMSMQFCADMKDALIELSTLTAKVKRYEEVIEAALRLQDLWLYTGKITVEHASEAQALNLMKRNFEAALNQGED